MCINYRSNVKMYLQYYIINTKVINMQSNTIYLRVHSYVVKVQRKDTAIFETEVTCGKKGRKMRSGRGTQSTLDCSSNTLFIEPGDGFLSMSF